jgi:low affinity Fe/Cu permease
MATHKNDGHSFGAWFGKAATRTASWVGSAWAFVLAVITVIVWAILGPRYHYSNTWQLVINTGTTIVTFLIVFLIQNTQNRDARALHLKLDEVIRAIRGAHNEMISIENLSDAELKEMADRYELVRKEWEVRNQRKLKPA